MRSARQNSGIDVSGITSEDTLDGAVHAAAAVQQVMCYTGRVSQGEEISQFTGGEAGVLCSFAQVNHCPREPLLGHLSLEYTLLNSTYKKINK